MTNIDLVSISKAITEICDSKELKAELKDAYSVVYAANKTRNKIKPLMESFSKAEIELNNAYNEAIPSATTEEEKSKLLKQLVEDKQKLYDTTVELEVHKINSDASPVIVKYLTAQSTFAYLEHLTDV